MNFRTEYRINKKGCECFRTGDENTLMTKLAELQQKRPNIYTIERRACQIDRYGKLLTDLSGNALWSSWSA